MWLKSGHVYDVNIGAYRNADVLVKDGRIAEIGRAPDKGGDTVEFVLQGEDLKSAVISYCIKDNIPLPQRGAKKRLQVFGGRLALIITINVTADRLSKL